MRLWPALCVVAGAASVAVALEPLSPPSPLGPCGPIGRRHEHVELRTTDLKKLARTPSSGSSSWTSRHVIRRGTRAASISAVARAPASHGRKTSTSSWSRMPGFASADGSVPSSIAICRP